MPNKPHTSLQVCFTSSNRFLRRHHAVLGNFQTVSCVYVFLLTKEKKKKNIPTTVDYVAAQFNKQA